MYGKIGNRNLKWSTSKKSPLHAKNSVSPKKIKMISNFENPKQKFLIFVTTYLLLQLQYPTKPSRYIYTYLLTYLMGTSNSNRK